MNIGRRFSIELLVEYVVGSVYIVKTTCFHDIFNAT